MPAVKTVKIIAMIPVGFFLFVPRAALAQWPDEAATLNQQVLQLYSQGRYSEAIPLAQRALAIREKALASDRPEVAQSLNNLGELYRVQVEVVISLNNLASLYHVQGRYADAEALYKRSLAINEKALGTEHPNVATSLNNLAALYENQGRYADAEPLYQRALAIREKTLGPNHPDVALSLNNLGGLHTRQGGYADAVSLYKRSLAISERALGPDHLGVTVSLTNLAYVYQQQGRYIDAEPLYKRSLAIKEKALGPDHPDVALSLNNLAELHRTQGRYADAEPLYKRSVAIYEKTFGPDHSNVATLLNNLALLCEAQGRYADAEPLYKHALTIREKILGPDHPDVALSLNNLAALYRTQGRYADAGPLFKRSPATQEKALGPDHPVVAYSLNNLAALYQMQDRYTDTEPLYKRSLAIYEKALGPDHPDVALSLNNLAELYRTQGRHADAEPLVKRSLAIREKTLGPNHPDVALSLNNLAALYQMQGRYADAEPLYKRSVAIYENVFGPDHPSIATWLNNLASLHHVQGRYVDAEPLAKRALAIQEKALGPNHPNLALSLNNLAAHYGSQGRLADALPFVKRTITQNGTNKSIAFAVLHGSQSEDLISPTQALNASYTVLQRSVSSAAGEAVSKLAARFAAGANELAQLVRKDQDLTAEADRLDKSIISAVSKPSAERNHATEDQIRKHIDEIRSEREKLQNIFNQRFPDYVALSKPEPLTIEQTQVLLADDEALIAVDLDKKSYVWVITKDRAEWKELPVSAEDVSKEVSALRAGLNPSAPQPFDRKLAYHLYQQVLGPIEEIFAQKRRLSFVFDGALTSLPPQVLITTDLDGKDLNSVDWLIRKYAVTMLPSTASLKILRSEKSTVAATKPMIGFGDPVFDRTAQTRSKAKVANFERSLPTFYRGVIADTTELAKALPPLPETADELRAVGMKLGARSDDIKLGAAATVADVKHEKLANYRIVYFATHALVAGEVEKFAKVKAEPALVLSIPDKPTEEDDGLLRASDVAMLKMNADFVVLSACNTATGDKPGAEALSGLARAFFYAGARSLVVSNWEVDSESTVALMTGLFDALKADPHLSHAEAFRLSMLKMIDKPSKPEWVQPKFWAPFVVVGEPRK